MKRGEIYYANLNPATGAESNKKRPVVIVSNNANNKAASTLTILPITSNVEKIYPFEILLESKISGLSKASKIQCQQIRTIAKQRIVGEVVGYLNKMMMQQIELALKLHLDLN